MRLLSHDVGVSLPDCFLREPGCLGCFWWERCCLADGYAIEKGILLFLKYSPPIFIIPVQGIGHALGLYNCRLMQK